MKLNRNKVSLLVRKFKKGDPLHNGNGIMMIYGNTEEIYSSNSIRPGWWTNSPATVRDYKYTKLLYDFAGYIK